jgi:copper chaperone CopZ
MRHISIAVVCSFIMFWSFGCSRDVSAARAQATTLHFAVRGMHCTGCEEAIKAKLAKLPGVTGCEASHTAGTVDLTTTDPSIAQSAIESIDSLGYTSTIAANTK